MQCLADESGGAFAKFRHCASAPGMLLAEFDEY
jgi:hypothetical protein